MCKIKMSFRLYNLIIDKHVHWKLFIEHGLFLEAKVQIIFCILFLGLNVT